MTTQTTAPPDTARLFQMITGMVYTHSVFVAAELGIADLLIDGPRSVDHLARATGTHADSLYRLLRMLAGEGVFAEDEEGRFGLTPSAELLRSDSPSHIRDFARMLAGDQGKAWNELMHSIRTGEPAFDHVFGMPLFDYLKEHPDKARIFDGAMIGAHGPETQPMIEGYDFSGFDTVVDIGGASGAVLLEILRACPGVTGVVFDLPQIAEQAAAKIAESDCADRCRAEGGSFFNAVPGGADCYVMRHIIHDWDDERSITILRHCHEAMRPEGKVLVVETVLPAGNEPHLGKMFDVVMLAIPGGRERTAEQYDKLFAAAGLKMTRIVPTAAPVSVVEGVRA